MSHSTDSSVKSESASHSPVENNFFSPREGETSAVDTSLQPPDSVPSWSVTEPRVVSPKNVANSSAFPSDSDEPVREEVLPGHQLQGEVPTKGAPDESPSHSSLNKKSIPLKDGILSLSSSHASTDADKGHPLPSDGCAENNPTPTASEFPPSTDSVEPPPNSSPPIPPVPRRHTFTPLSSDSPLEPSSEEKEAKGNPSHATTVTHPDQGRVEVEERRDPCSGDKQRSRKSLRITVPTSDTPVWDSSEHLATSASCKKQKSSCSPHSTTRTTAGCTSRSPDVQTKEAMSPVIAREDTVANATLVVNDVSFCSGKTVSVNDTDEREEELPEDYDGSVKERSTSGRQRLNSSPGSLCSHDFSSLEKQAWEANGVVPTAPGSRVRRRSEKTNHSSSSSRRETTRKNSEKFPAIDLAKFPTIAIPTSAANAESHALLSESEYSHGARESEGEKPKDGKEDEQEGKHVQSDEKSAIDCLHLSSSEVEESNAHTTASQRLDEVLRNSALFKGIHLRWLLIFLICIVCAFVIIFLFQFFHFTNKNSLFNGRNSVFEKSADVLGNTELLIIDTMTFFITDGYFNFTPVNLPAICSRVSGAPMGFAVYNKTSFELIHSQTCPGFEDVTFEEKIPAIETASDAVQFVDHSYRSVLSFIAPYHGRGRIQWPLITSRYSSGMTTPFSAPTTTSSCVDDPSLLFTIDTVEGTDDQYGVGTLPSCENHSTSVIASEGSRELQDQVYAVLFNKEQFGRIVLSTFDYKYSSATLRKTVEAFLARSWNSTEINVFLHSLTPNFQSYTTQNGSDVSIAMKRLYDQDCQDLSEVWHTVLHVSSNLTLYYTRHPIVNPQLEYKSFFRLLSSVSLCSVVCTKNDMNTENFTENINSLFCEADNPTNLWFVIRVEDFGQRIGVLMTVVIGSISVAVFSVLILIIYISVAVPVGFIRQQLFRIVGVHENIPPWKKQFYQCSYPLWIGDISSLTSSLHVLGISFNMNKKYVPNHILRKHAREMEAMCQKFHAGDLFDILKDSQDVQAEEVEQLEDLSEFVHLNADPGRGDGREGGGRMGVSNSDGFAGSSGGLHYHRGNRGGGKGLAFPSARYLFSGAASMLDSIHERWALDGEQESGTKPFALTKELGKMRRRESSAGPLDTSKHSYTPPHRGSKDGLADLTSYRSRDERDRRPSSPRKTSCSWFSGGNGATGLTEEENIGVKVFPVQFSSQQDSLAGTASLLEPNKKKAINATRDSFSKEGRPLSTGSGAVHPLTFWRRWSNTILRPGNSSEDVRCPPPPPLGGGGPSLDIPQHSSAESRSSSRLTGAEHSAERQELRMPPTSQGSLSKENTLFSSSSTMVIKQVADSTILVVKLDCIDNVYLINFEVALRQHRRIMRYLLARIRHWGGAVFHRSGDCLAAAWNAFDTCPNHASRATACGMEIVGAFAVYRSLGLLVGVVIHAGMFICGIFEDAKEAFSTAFGAAAREAMLIADLVATQNSFGLIVSEPVKQATAGLYDSIIVDVIKHPDDVHPIVLFELRYRRLYPPDEVVSSVAIKNRQQFSIQYAKAFAHFLQHEYTSCIKLLELMRDIAPEETQPQLSRMELLSYYFDSHPDEMPPFPYFRSVPSWTNYERKAWREWQGGRSDKTLSDPLPPLDQGSPVTSRPSVSWIAKNTLQTSGFGSSFLHFGRRRSSSLGTSERNASASTASVSPIDNFRGSLTDDGTDPNAKTPHISRVIAPGSGREDNAGGGAEGVWHAATEAGIDPSASSLPLKSAPAARPRSGSREGGIGAPEEKSVPPPLPSSSSVLFALKDSFSHLLAKKDKKKKGSERMGMGEQNPPSSPGTEMEEETMTTTVSPMIPPPLASLPSSILTSAREGKRRKSSVKEMRSSTTPTFPHMQGHHEKKISAFAGYSASSSSSSSTRTGEEKEEKRYRSSGSFLTGMAAPFFPGEKEHEEKRSAEPKVSISDLSSHDVETHSGSSRASAVPKLHSTHSTPITTKVPRLRLSQWSQRSAKKPDSSLPSMDKVLSTPAGGEPLRPTPFSFPAVSPPTELSPHGKRRVPKKNRMPSVLSFLSIHHHSSTPLSTSLPPCRPFAESQTNYSMFAIFPPSPSSPGRRHDQSPSMEDSVGSDGEGFSSLLGGLQARRRSFPLGEVEMDRDIQGFKKDLQDNIRRHQSSTERLTASSLGPQGIGREGQETRVEKDECLATPVVPPPRSLPSNPSFPSCDERNFTPSYRPPPIRTTTPSSGSAGCSPHQIHPLSSTQSSGTPSSEGTGIRSAGVGYAEETKGGIWKGDVDTVLPSQPPSQVCFFSSAPSFVGSHPAPTVAKEDSEHLDPLPVTPFWSSGSGGGGILLSPSGSKASPPYPTFVTPGGKAVKPSSQRYGNRSSPSVSPLSAKWNASHPTTPGTPAGSIFSHKQHSFVHAVHRDASAGVMEKEVGKSILLPSTGSSSTYGGDTEDENGAHGIASVPRGVLLHPHSSRNVPTSGRRGTVPSSSFVQASPTHPGGPHASFAMHHEENSGRSVGYSYGEHSGSSRNSGSTPSLPLSLVPAKRMASVGGRQETTPKGTPMTDTSPLSASHALLPTLIPVASHRTDVPMSNVTRTSMEEAHANTKVDGRGEDKEWAKPPSTTVEKSPFSSSPCFLHPFPAYGNTLPHALSPSIVEPPHPVPLPTSYAYAPPSPTPTDMEESNSFSCPNGSSLAPYTPTGVPAEEHRGNGVAVPCSSIGSMKAVEERGLRGEGSPTRSQGQKGGTVRGHEMKTLSPHSPAWQASGNANFLSVVNSTPTRRRTAAEGGLGMGLPTPMTILGKEGAKVSSTMGSVHDGGGSSRKSPMEEVGEPTDEGRSPFFVPPVRILHASPAEQREEAEENERERAGREEPFEATPLLWKPADMGGVEEAVEPSPYAAAITGSIIQSIGLTLPTINLPYIPQERGEDTHRGRSSPSVGDGGSPPISTSHYHAGGDVLPPSFSMSSEAQSRRSQRSSSVPLPVSSVPTTIMAKNGILYQRSERVLGSGSFGSVYLGMDVRSGKLVAIKVLRLPTEETEGRNVEAEALIMRVKDPHVVEFISYAFQDHAIIIIMECMLAGSLHNMLTSFRVLPSSTARVFIRDVLRGLNKLHSMGVIHRDVKPQNVLLTPAGNCKITDFGASAELAQLAHGNTVHGTPVYLAPEAARGNPAAVSDIWSCGIMFIQLVTGILPYPLEKLQLPAEVLVFQIGAGIATPAIPEDLLDELELDFVVSCLAPDEEKRPSASRLLQSPLFVM